MAVGSSQSTPHSNIKPLYSDPYVELLLTDQGRLLRVVRTALPHPNLATLLDSFGRVIAAVDRAGRIGRGLVIDTRAPTGRNDPWFEEGMAAVRPRLDAQFARVGVLVRSAMGALQIRRFVSEDGMERLASADEQALVAVLLKAIPPRLAG